jgi:hypothetical protein
MARLKPKNVCWSCFVIWVVKQFKVGSQHSWKMVCFEMLCSIQACIFVYWTSMRIIIRTEKTTKNIRSRLSLYSSSRDLWQSRHHQFKVYILTHVLNPSYSLVIFTVKKQQNAYTSILFVASYLILMPVTCPYPLKQT